ncbi:undecaprenyl pyrophosphate phosphatase [bacterium BMS3Abin04]|nr:undecaprenyl pyrophosphate phosphatase [bacterium BMS3Abin04]
MFHFLYSIDVNLFYFINHSLANPVFDKFFVFITDVNHWYITYIILWFIVFLKGGKIGKIAAIGSIFLIVASDQFSSAFLKNLIERIRPCNQLPDVRLLVGCSGSYSMPSSHAVNNFAIAVYFYRIYPKFKWLLLTIASLVAFSRPYIGVHYPSDIIVGAIIGAVIGYIFSIFVLEIDKKFGNKNIETST